jgi:predicted transglutaminase-like cysteine proteinase
MKFWSLAILIGTAAYCVSEGASARSAADKHGPHHLPQAHMRIYGATEAPVGHVQFCESNPDDCRMHGRSEPEVELTTKRWQELVTINRQVNQEIKPMSDQAQYGVIEKWTYPTSGKGDCEDYVLLKKRKLVELGWPMSGLLITVVRDENNEGHAVLTVRTDSGDLVLDNKTVNILAWQQTKYTYIKRQSAVDPKSWESLIPMRVAPTVAASGADLDR